MARLLNQVTSPADRIQPAEGRVRRLASASRGEAAAVEFRSMVASEASASAPRQASGWSGLVSGQPAGGAASDGAPQAAGSTALPRAAPAPKPVSGWAGLVTPAVADPAPAPAPPPAESPTAESVFGPSPWAAAPSGQGPLGVYYYNPVYFATAPTAVKVAEMVGGKVVERNFFTGAAGSPFQQRQPNYMVELPDGRLINPGLVASFYTHGYSQSYIDRLLSIEAGPTVA